MGDSVGKFVGEFVDEPVGESVDESDVESILIRDIGIFINKVSKQRFRFRSATCNIFVFETLLMM